AGLLGTNEHGHWQISPSEKYSVKRNYLEGSLVLETVFETADASFRLVDCMPFGEEHPSLIRLVEGIRGTSKIDFVFSPRFDFGSLTPWIQRTEENSFTAL